MLKSTGNRSIAPDIIDDRLQAFGLEGRWRLVWLILVYLYALSVVWLYLTLLTNVLHDRPTFNNDFRIFWAAARIALTDGPLSTFSVDRIIEVNGVIDEGWMPWSYPPAFLVAVLPLGALSFPTAWVVFTAVSVIAIFIAMRPLSGGRRSIWLAFSCAPAFLPAFFMGQTSILWTAGLIAALTALHGGRPVLAGFLIGLLTLKPQLGILIPVALLAIGTWRTILAASITTIAISLLATLIVGFDYWPALRAMMHEHFMVLSRTIADEGRMASAFSILAGLGLPITSALTIQWCITILAAAAIAVTWRSKTIEFDLKAAVLCTGIMLSTPYLWHYETALLAPIAIYLVRAGVLGANLPSRLIVLLMWLGLGPALVLIIFGASPSLRYAFVPAMLASIAVCTKAVYVRLNASCSTVSNL